MMFLLPRSSPETSVSEASTTIAVFHSRVFARDAVATNIVNIRSLSFFIGPPLRSIMPFSFLPDLPRPVVIGSVQTQFCNSYEIRQQGFFRSVSAPGCAQQPVLMVLGKILN